MANFPPALLDSALAVWKASVRQTGRISRMHEEVSRALWSLGIAHTNEQITSDGLFCVDIALQDTQVGLLLLTQRPENFSPVTLAAVKALPASHHLDKQLRV